MLGTTLSHYRIDRQLGQGGMGTVYLATDEVLGREVAIKVVRSELVGDDEARMRFLREARTAASLDHPFICRIFDVLESETDPALVMERIRGLTLHEWVATRPSRDEVLRLASEISEAVEAAHTAGIVHRDLKPSNILVTPSGHPKILDFGLAKPVALEAGATQMITERLITQEAAIFGTWGYLAPELLRGEQASKSSDLFALGCILYYMASGHQPFLAATPADGISRTLSTDPEPPSTLGSNLPRDFDTLVARLLSKQPSARPASASTVIDSLKALRVGDEAEVLLAGGSEARTSRWRGVAGIAIGLLLVIVFSMWLAQEEPLEGDIVILPLQGSPASLDAPGALLTSLSSLLDSDLRISPPGLDRDEVISPEQRQDVRHLLDWTVVPEGGELRLSVLLDGDPGFTANYVAQTTESLHDLITGPVAQDIAAFRLSLDARDSSYPSGCEQTRASPITPSDEAAQVLQKAHALYRSGFTWEALNLTERALELDPRFAQASLLRGRLLFNVGTPYTGDILAVPEMHRALALPQRLEPWERELLERAMQFLSDGPSQAIPKLTPELLEDLGEVVRVEAEYAISLFREERRRALELSYDLLARNLNSFDVLVNGAGLVLDLDYTAEATEQVVRPLLEAHANDPRSHMTHGLLMIVHPEAIDRAEASLERSRELQGGQWQPRFGWLAGKMQYYAGRYERSLEILTESLGTTTHRDRFTSSQLEEMSVATRHDPIVDPRIYAFLALSSRALGRLDDAGRYLASHRKVLPGNPWTDYEEGRLLMLLEKPEDAAQSFTRVLELDPSYTFAWFRRGRARLEIGDVSGARADLNHFVESMGSDALKHPRVVEALELLKAGNSPEDQG